MHGTATSDWTQTCDLYNIVYVRGNVTRGNGKHSTNQTMEVHWTFITWSDGIHSRILPVMV